MGAATRADNALACYGTLKAIAAAKDRNNAAETYHCVQHLT